MGVEHVGIELTRWRQDTNNPIRSCFTLLDDVKKIICLSISTTFDDNTDCKVGFYFSQ